MGKPLVNVHICNLQEDEDYSLKDTAKQKVC